MNKRGRAAQDIVTRTWDRNQQATRCGCYVSDEECMKDCTQQEKLKKAAKEKEKKMKDLPLHSSSIVPVDAPLTPLSPAEKVQLRDQIVELLHRLRADDARLMEKEKLER